MSIPTCRFRFYTACEDLDWANAKSEGSRSQLNSSLSAVTKFDIFACRYSLKSSARRDSKPRFSDIQNFRCLIPSELPEQRNFITRLHMTTFTLRKRPGGLQITLKIKSTTLFRTTILLSRPFILHRSQVSSLLTSRNRISATSPFNVFGRACFTSMASSLQLKNVLSSSTSPYVRHIGN